MATKTSKILHFYDFDLLEEKDKKSYLIHNIIKKLKYK